MSIEITAPDYPSPGLAARINFLNVNVELLSGVIADNTSDKILRNLQTLYRDPNWRWDKSTHISDKFVYSYPETWRVRTVEQDLRLFKATLINKRPPTATNYYERFSIYANGKLKAFERAIVPEQIFSVMSETKHFIFSGEMLTAIEKANRLYSNIHPGDMWVQAAKAIFEFNLDSLVEGIKKNQQKQSETQN